MHNQILPQELVDQIIDDLCDDRDCLRSCRLACRTWLNRANIHYFRDARVHVKTGSDPTKYKDRFRPENARLTRHLFISGATSQSVYTPTVVELNTATRYALKSVFPHFLSLQTVEIAGVSIPVEMVELLFLIGNRNGVHELRMKGVASISYHDFRDTLLAFTNLHTLVLCGLSVYTTRQPAAGLSEATLESLPHLEHLSLATYDGSISSDITRTSIGVYQALDRFVGSNTLRSIAIADEFAVIGVDRWLPARCPASLEELTLWQTNIGTPRLNPTAQMQMSRNVQIDLSIFTGLRHLAFRHAGIIYPVVIDLAAMNLASIAHTTVEQVDLILEPADRAMTSISSWSSWNWNSLETALETSLFANLCSLRVVILCDSGLFKPLTRADERRMAINDPLKKLEKRFFETLCKWLPSLHARGILQLAVNPEGIRSGYPGF